jgi:hypothetical protein
MRMDHETAREHIDAAALGALDVDDARAFAAHVSGCAECSRLMTAASDDAASLALAVPLVSSSAALKSRVMASAAVLAELRTHRVPRRWPAAVAASLVLGIGATVWGTFAQTRVNDLEGERSALGASATVQSRDIASARDELQAAAAVTTALATDVQTQDAVLDVVMERDVVGTDLIGTAVAPSATGRCLWSTTKTLGAFVVDNLPPPVKGTEYRMWLMYEARWVNGGAFDVDETGHGRLLMRRPWGDEAAGLGAFIGFAVTAEPIGNGETRTGAMVMQSARS